MNSPNSDITPDDIRAWLDKLQANVKMVSEDYDNAQEAVKELTNANNRLAQERDLLRQELVKWRDSANRHAANYLRAVDDLYAEQREVITQKELAARNFNDYVRVCSELTALKRKRPGKAKRRKGA